MKGGHEATNDKLSQAEAPEHLAVFLMNSSDLPASEKTISRISNDITAVNGAAVITTVRVLAVAVYYILANPQYEKRLRDELSAVMEKEPHSVPGRSRLEQASFLVACVKEALR